MEVVLVFYCESRRKDYSNLASFKNIIDYYVVLQAGLHRDDTNAIQKQLGSKGKFIWTRNIHSKTTRKNKLIELVKEEGYDPENTWIIMIEDTWSQINITRELLMNYHLIGKSMLFSSIVDDTHLYRLKPIFKLKHSFVSNRKGTLTNSTTSNTGYPPFEFFEYKNNIRTVRFGSKNSYANKAYDLYQNGNLSACRLQCLEGIKDETIFKREDKYMCFLLLAEIEKDHKRYLEAINTFPPRCREAWFLHYKMTGYLPSLKNAKTEYFGQFKWFISRTIRDDIDAEYQKHFTLV